MTLVRVPPVRREPASRAVAGSAAQRLGDTDRTAVRAAIPLVIAQPIVDLVTGPLQPATVVATHSAAVLLSCDAVEPARVIAVLTAEASGVPNGARTTLRAADRPFAGLAVGDAAFVGGGGIQLRGLALRAARSVRTGVPRVHVSAGAVARIGAAATMSAKHGVPWEPVAELQAALAAGVPARLRAVVAALVGLGTGSTPGGDDVLCGTLAGLHATGREVLAHQVAVAALDDVASRTPLLSADLLRLAAAGHACTEADAVLRAAARGPGLDLDRAVAALLSIGHTSGTDLATGLALGLGAPVQPMPAQPRYRAPVRVAG